MVGQKTGRRNRKEKLSQSFFSSKIVSAEPSSESLPSLNLLIMLAFRLCNQWLGKKPGRNNNREKLSNMFCLFFQNAQQLNLGKPSSPYQPHCVISQSYSLCSTLQNIAARDCVTATRRLGRNNRKVITKCIPVSPLDLKMSIITINIYRSLFSAKHQIN